MLDRIRNEPVIVTNLTASVCVLLVAFGLNLSDVQIAAVLGVVNTALAFVARSRVTPAE